jgi:hypothetical protein
VHEIDEDVELTLGVEDLVEDPCRLAILFLRKRIVARSLTACGRGRRRSAGINFVKERRIVLLLLIVVTSPFIRFVLDVMRLCGKRSLFGLGTLGEGKRRTLP